jgi:hypothetical protein
MYRSIDRTNRLTRRVMALLAEHRLKRSHLDFRIFRALPQPLDPDPVHIAAVVGIVLAYNRDIVFHRASRHTSLTTRAEILIDHHAPNADRSFFWSLILNTGHF